MKDIKKKWVSERERKGTLSKFLLKQTDDARSNNRYQENVLTFFNFEKLETNQERMVFSLWEE